jgi:hypothetical protein
MRYGADALPHVCIYKIEKCVEAQALVDTAPPALLRVDKPGCAGSCEVIPAPAPWVLILTTPMP